MKINARLFFSLWLLWSSTLFAQPKISVKSFEQKENDLTARIDAPKKDQNGDVCAIIKVVTPQTGFIWEPDGLGIVSAEYKTGEYWLYVPYGAKRLTIKHDKLGNLIDYMYPIPIEKAMVYIMELKTSKVITTIDNEQIASNKVLTSANSGILKIVTSPTGATITLGGDNIGTTPATVPNLLFGDYTLTLSLPGYATTTKTFTIAEGKTAQITETLAKGRDVTIASEPNGAALSIDGNPVGYTPYISSLTFGNHTLKIQQGEKKAEKTISIPQSGDEISFSLTFDPQSFTETVNGVSFDMVAIKGGTFQMGSKKNNVEKPIHTVTLSNFSIGKTEVTQTLWKAIMGNNPSYFKGDSLPVEQVSWDDVQVFLDKLNQKTGKTYRLPTEAEWEYATGGGENNRTEFFGTNNESSLSDYTWWSANSNGITHVVNTKQPNSLGLYDMSGNVWEWCSDWYGSYSISPQNNPKGASSGSSRVLRGGSLDDIYYDHFRTAFRRLISSDSHFYYIGFRCVRSL
ncbi:MAG: SUMF1/EgtB/PvdO family nonheme iron enzyme [Mariniphaga sp.]